MYFEVSTSGNGPDFGGGGTPNVAIGSTLGPDGLPVASSPAGVSDVDPTTNEITWWDPSLNSGVVETGTGFDSLPYASNMYAPDSTGPNDATYYETAILQGTFSLSAAQSVTFQVGSDDDSFIYVDGTLIGSNPAFTAPRRRTSRPPTWAPEATRLKYSTTTATRAART